MALTGCIDDNSCDVSENRNNAEPKQKQERDVSPSPIYSKDGALSGLTTFPISQRDSEDMDMTSDPCQLQNRAEPPQGDNNNTNISFSPQLGAGIFLGFSGLFIGGPVVGVAAGAAAAYAASRDDGPVGNAARATGEWIVTNGSKVSEAAKEADRRHGVIDRLKEALYSGWRKVQKFDQDNKASSKVVETVKDISNKTVEFEQKHHIIETMLEGIQSGVQKLLDKLRSATKSDQNDRT